MLYQFRKLVIYYFDESQEPTLDNTLRCKTKTVRGTIRGTSQSIGVLSYNRKFNGCVLHARKRGTLS